MRWREIKATARAAVHRTFAYDGVYVAKGGGPQKPCKVRIHTRNEVFGDLDREGYARVWEGVTGLIYDDREISPTRGGEFIFDTNFRFNVDTVGPKEDMTNFRKVKVTAILPTP